MWWWTSSLSFGAVEKVVVVVCVALVTASLSVVQCGCGWYAGAGAHADLICNNAY